MVSALAVPWVEVSISSLREALYLLVLPFVITVPLHEGLHALTARLLGARVRFGVTGLGKFVLAPYIAVETPIPTRKYLLVSLAPLVLSIASLSTAWLSRSNLWALVYIFNTAGMAGDFLTALVLLGMPPDAKVFDDGILLRSDEEIPGPYPRWVSSAMKVAILLLLLMFIIMGRVEVVVEGG